MSSLVMPVPRSLILCDAVTQTTAGKVHLANVFNAIRVSGFPHAGTRVGVFAQLSGAVGDMSLHVSVRDAAHDVVIHRSDTTVVRYPDRRKLVRVSVVLARCVFPRPGLYTVELFCHNSFVCDTTLLVHTGGGDDT